MDFDGDEVDIHLCAFKANGKVSDSRTYNKFNINTAHYLRCLLETTRSQILRDLALTPRGAHGLYTIMGENGTCKYTR